MNSPWKSFAVEEARLTKPGADSKSDQSDLTHGEGLTHGDFFNFMIMMSSCHMSSEIQIANPNVDIMSYQPISGLEKQIFKKIKKNILQTPKYDLGKQV